MGGSRGESVVDGSKGEVCAGRRSTAEVDRKVVEGEE